MQLKNRMGMYVLPYPINYYSKRYDRKVRVKVGTESDGATGAFDIWSNSWWVHDELSKTGKWSDGTPCNNLQASMVIHDILDDEGRWVRAKTWMIMTWLFGGGKARENGMW